MNKAVCAMMTLLALTLGFAPAAMTATAEKVRLVVVLHDQGDFPAAQAKEMAGLVWSRLVLSMGMLSKVSPSPCRRRLRS